MIEPAADAGSFGAPVVGLGDADGDCVPDLAIAAPATGTIPVDPLAPSPSLVQIGPPLTRGAVFLVSGRLLHVDVPYPSEAGDALSQSSKSLGPREGATMTISTTCKGCGRELIASDENDLVSKVEAHLAEAHPGGHTPSREQILTVIRGRGTQS